MKYDEKGRRYIRPGWSDFRQDKVLKLTKKADYALMAMKHLADHGHEKSASAKDVADSFGFRLRR